MKLLEAERALVKMPALTMEGRTKRRAGESVGSPRRTRAQLPTLDTRAFHGDDVGTLGGSSTRSKKTGIVGWDGHSDNQCTTNVEDKNAPKDTTDGPDNVATGAFGFRSSAASARVSNR